MTKFDLPFGGEVTTRELRCIA